MRKEDLPSVGTKLKIEWMKNREKYEKQHLLSHVIDIVNDHELLIAIPTLKNVITPISVGEIINIQYSKKGLASYIFKAEVVNRRNTNKLSCMKIRKSSEISRIQQRDYFRLKMVTNAEIKTIDPQSGEEITMLVLTKDISGGGLRVISKKELQVGNIVDIKIDTNKKSIVVKGKVLRCTIDEKSDHDFDVGISFTYVNQKDREEIISFIFEYQRKLRKKGLI